MKASQEELDKLDNYIDRLITERAMLLEACKYALQISDIWLLDESIALEHETEATALAMMHSKIQQAINKADGN